MKIYSPTITGSIANTNIVTTTRITSLSALSASFASTASFVQNAQSASYVLNAVSASRAVSSSRADSATTASYVLNAVSSSFAATSSFANSFTVGGTLTAQTINVQTITSSIEFVTGSTRNGSLAANTHQFTGSVLMTGSLTVTTTGTELQVNAGGVSIGNALTDNHIISGSLRINPNGLFVSSSGNVGIGTTTDRTTVIGASGTGQTIGGSGTPNLTIWNTGNADWVYSTAVGNDGTVYHYNKANTDMYYYTNNIARMIIKNGGNVGIGASTSPTYKLEVSTAAGSERIRVGTLQNNNNTATFEAITSAGISTATSGWIRAVFGGGLALGTSTYTKAGGDSGNFANLSSESATTGITVEGNGNVSFAKAQKHPSNLWHVIPFGVQKGNGAGSADSRTIIEITSGDFNEYFIHINYGARLQNVSDSVTNISSRMYGVNRFNSGAVAVTDSAIMAGSGGTINTHAPITAVASTSTKVIVKVDFSSSCASASFVWGEIRIFSWEGFTPTIINNSW
jgi:hypothetical protein